MFVLVCWLDMLLECVYGCVCNGVIILKCLLFDVVEDG